MGERHRGPGGAGERRRVGRGTRRLPRGAGAARARSHGRRRDGDGLRPPRSTRTRATPRRSVWRRAGRRSTW
jgi:hypothetical protein